MLTREYPPWKLVGYFSSASSSFSMYVLDIFCCMTSFPQSSSNHGWVVFSVAVLVNRRELSIPAISRST